MFSNFEVIYFPWNPAYFTRTVRNALMPVHVLLKSKGYEGFGMEEEIPQAAVYRQWELSSKDLSFNHISYGHI